MDEVDISALFKKLVDGLVKIFKTLKNTYTFNTLNKFKVCRFGLEFMHFEFDFFFKVGDSMVFKRAEWF